MRCNYCGAVDDGTCAFPSEGKPGCLAILVKKGVPCGTEGALYVEHLMVPELDYCPQCGHGWYALALMHSLRNEDFPQRLAPRYKATEHLAGDKGPRCSWCLGVTHKHEAIFSVMLKLDDRGDETIVHELCWCCWFGLAFQEGGYSHGSNDTAAISYQRRSHDCERRSFNRWERRVALLRRWPAEWLEGYLAGTSALVKP